MNHDLDVALDDSGVQADRLEVEEYSPLISPKMRLQA